MRIRSSPEQPFSFARDLFACVLLGGLLLPYRTGAAQSSEAPTAPYGPPVCSGVPASSEGDPLQQARDEQRAGELNSGMLPSYEPLENFAVERYRLLAYGECHGDGGCYWADLDAQYRRAEGALRVALAHHKPGEKLAVVMDIDETTLSNYCEMKRQDFGYNGPVFGQWETSAAAAAPIPGARRLFDQARAAGASVFFVTGRAGIPAAGAKNPISDETAATDRNLRAAGFAGWAGLALRNGSENDLPTIQYKSEERSKIVAQGYRIVLSVGDQWSDLLGQPQAEVSVKLPNPFYFLP